MVVTGRVQNIWYRDSCRSEALARAVAGWVRNRSDGSVEAVFEGPPPSVDELVAWCGQGPAWARVEGVETIDEEPRGETTFSIR